MDDELSAFVSRVRFTSSEKAKVVGVHELKSVLSSPRRQSPGAQFNVGVKHLLRFPSGGINIPSTKIRLVSGSSLTVIIIQYVVEYVTHFGVGMRN